MCFFSPDPDTFFFILVHSAKTDRTSFSELAFAILYAKVRTRISGSPALAVNALFALQQSNYNATLGRAVDRRIIYFLVRQSEDEMKKVPDFFPVSRKGNKCKKVKLLIKCNRREKIKCGFDLQRQSLPPFIVVLEIRWFFKLRISRRDRNSNLFFFSSHRVTFCGL